MFEQAHVSGLYLLDSSIATLFGIGHTSGIVLDVGYTRSRVGCVLDSCLVSHGVIPLGSRDIDLVHGFQGDQVQTLAKKQSSQLNVDVLFNPSLVGTCI